MSIHLTLDRIQRLAARLDRFTRPTIHVAGTNGKGSVTCIIASILRASGLSVGRFNSPHLVSIYDSILINDRPVSPSTYNDARTLVLNADHQLKTEASSFELLTLTALQLFEVANLDIVVIEVGMGGRHDATNIIPDNCILVSALTAVDLDHQKFLGDTVELIAEHKAGIARPGKPFVLGPQKHPSVEAVARRVVKSPEICGYFILSTPVQSRPLSVESCFSPSSRPFVFPSGQPIQFHSAAFTSPIHANFPLHGAHQLDNLALSLSVISALLTYTTHQTLSHRITSETVRAGIEMASWPGRLSFHRLSRSITRGLRYDPLTVLVDGAHNPASAETLASYISGLIASPKPRPKLHITYILGLSHSPPKTPFETLSPVLSRHSPEDPLVKVRVATLRFTPPEGMPWVTPVAPSAIRDTVLQLITLRGEDVWSASDNGPIDDQLQSALKWTEAGQVESGEGEEKLVVLAGSLYLVADFYRFLKQLEGSISAV
ncbi:FolC bifunctional protein [Gyrodon lividus]|nr:FolC bifunctional protein [Gyrodon lividus]